MQVLVYGAGGIGPAGDDGYYRPGIKRLVMRFVLYLMISDMRREGDETDV